MNKVMMHTKLYIGKMQDCGYPIFLKVNFTDGKFSISGVEGPLKSGNCKGSCGQIRDSLLECRPEGDLTKEQLVKLHGIWEEWHLNDMVAGSPAQEKFLKENPVSTHNTSHYQAATIALNNAGLNPDPEHIVNGNPYKYGSSWIYKEVPEEVIEWVFNLPPSSRVPNWV